jgi:crotonobetainyl-CoA:carnitine CoA-transferase CaiB-like acyl-CoA transferase
MSKVLEGIRVLDFGRFIAAPYCGMILADMGAEVIRIDRPGGEEDRTIGLKGPNGENLGYPSYARNKKCISLNVLSKEAPRDVLEDLVRASDIFLHNFSPGAIKAFSLTYDDIRAIKPEIIYTGISCYGATGPYSDRVGFDQIAQTFSGAAALNGYEGDAPLRSGLPWVDYSTGLCAMIGTLLALRHRDATGNGQMVDCALLQTAMSFMAPMVAEAEVLGKERPRLGNRSAYVGPTDLYRCSDGYVYVASIMEGMWRRLMKIVGHEELVGHEDFDTDLKRFDRRDEVDPFVEEWMAQHSVEEVVATMDEHRIPCGVYHSTAEVASDPHVQARKMLEYMDLGEPGFERVPVCGIPIRLSETPGEVRDVAPRVGQHNDEYYRDLLGYSDEKLLSLSQSGHI